MNRALLGSIDIPIEYYIIAMLLMLMIGVVHFYKRRNVVVSVAWALLIGYLFLIFSSTVLARTAESEYDYNFRLFWSYIAIMDGKESLLELNIANVLMLMPVGILVACIGVVGWKKVALIGVAVSGAIEFFQLILKRGMFEFDDVFHNTLGCVIGYLIYRLYKCVRNYMRRI